MVLLLLHPSHNDCLLFFHAIKTSVRRLGSGRRFDWWQLRTSQLLHSLNNANDKPMYIILVSVDARLTEAAVMCFAVPMWGIICIGVAILLVLLICCICICKYCCCKKRKGKDGKKGAKIDGKGVTMGNLLQTKVSQYYVSRQTY